jgi:hypothetical protein
MRAPKCKTAGENDRRWRLGDDVYDSHGRKLGSVVAADPQVVTVERGCIPPSTLYVPACFVHSSDAGRIQLYVSQEEATRAGWDRPSGRPPRPLCPPLWGDY